MHRSWCAEHPGHPSNERLEFLGDAVLGVIVTDHVYRVYPDLDEGALTEIRKTVVNSVALAEVAEDLGVGEHLLLGKGEELSGGREKPSILADARTCRLDHMRFGLQPAGAAGKVWDRLVGATGFEPATPCTPCKCATRLRHAPTEALV